MAKKMGRRARKFAKKNLQSVMKRKRKLNALFKKKFAPRKANSDSPEESKKLKNDMQTPVDPEEEILDGLDSTNLFGDLFIKEDDDFDADVSDSDGYLSEDPECPYISEDEEESCPEEMCNDVVLLEQNTEINQTLKHQKRKLFKLCKKAPQFSKFLESRRSELIKSKSEEIYSDDEGDTSSMDDEYIVENEISQVSKVITSSTVDVWCWLVMEQPNWPGLANLLNAFRAACHYGLDTGEVSPVKIANREVFSKILTFVLSEAKGIFCRLLRISGCLNKDTILKMTNKPEWKTMRPLIKSFLRSSLFLLNQETDSQVLVFVLSQLRLSILLFSAFPSLTKKLIKISIHLWVTGDKDLCASSFLILRDIASEFSLDNIDTCLTKAFGAFIANSKFMKPQNIEHIEFLENSIVELYSLDIQKSYQKVLVSVQQLASILRLALKTKKKDELKKIHSWQYINCIGLWVKFVSCNYKNHDLEQLLFLIIGVIKGIAHLFPGPRYLPLRFKCVKMLNQLSFSSGVFIPVGSFLFDCLEIRGTNNAEGTKLKHLDFALLLKVPKQLLKSQSFQQASILSAIKLLAEHLSQWCYHVSFPDLATIPLILLKRFHENTSLESVRRPVKRFIDQVQQNSDFIQRNRDGVSFSPKDKESVDSFLQLEKCDRSAAFTKFYNSMLQNALA
ncbi:protein REBELOTE-like isoform X1 [Curcuma longa]|uniref:protein REBELOTE-like isoform X1 n=2 Tax=Curcuma longa TaxID=136217 RepID=UPI003D9E950C